MRTGVVVGCALLVYGLPHNYNCDYSAAAKAAQKRPYALQLDRGWRRQAPPPKIKKTKTTPQLATRVLEVHRHRRSDRNVVVTRTSFPNFDARRHTNEYMKRIEVGLLRQPGYKRLRRRSHKRRRIPIVDYVFRRRDGGVAQVVMMRFVLYRHWAYVLTLTTPARRWRRWRKRNRKLIKSFGPRRRR